MIQEELQFIELCSDENRCFKYSDVLKQEELDEKQKLQISQQKRLNWIPLITKNILQNDTEPVFIYNLFKVMKNYDNEEREKYKNYGIQDAGIGQFDSIIFDKVNQNIDVSLSTYQFGRVDMNYLIQLYKSYQNQYYYDLALVLQEYQQFSNSAQQIIKTYCKQNSQLYNQEETFYKFERIVKEWVQTNLENEIYEIVIGDIDFQIATPRIKKMIFSKNLLLFISEELQDTYNELSLQRNIDYLTNFVRRRQQTDKEYEIERTIQRLKNIINRVDKYDVDDEIITLDGYCIPTKRTNQSFFYDYKTGQISKEVNTYFFTVVKYRFEPQWIKYLIDKRSNKNNIDKLNQANNLLKSQQTIIQNLEYICQQEYFLEKFNYIKQ